MFKDLEDLTIDIEYLLLDDSGEKVYSNKLKNEYDKLLIANHIILALKEMKCNVNFTYFNFKNINIIVYCIDDYFLFFFSETIIDRIILNRCSEINDKIKEIIGF